MSKLSVQTSGWREKLRRTDGCHCHTWDRLRVKTSVSSYEACLDSLHLRITFNNARRNSLLMITLRKISDGVVVATRGRPGVTRLEVDVEKFDVCPRLWLNCIPDLLMNRLTGAHYGRQSLDFGCMFDAACHKSPSHIGCRFTRISIGGNHTYRRRLASHDACSGDLGRLPWPPLALDAA